MRYFNVPVLVAINKFATDTDAEIAELTRLCDEFGCTCRSSMSVGKTAAKAALIWLKSR